MVDREQLPLWIDTLPDPINLAYQQDPFQLNISRHQVKIFCWYRSKYHIFFFVAMSSSRSPSMRRMRQLLDLDTVRTGAPSPVPTPSGTLPRGQRQLDINPAEFLKYKIDKPGMVTGGTSITGVK